MENNKMTESGAGTASHPMAGILGELCALARAAGAVEKQIFEGDFKAEIKQDGSPVTIADQKAEEIIIAKLADLTPAIPFLGEESVAAGDIPDISGGTYWCVDPLDGTKEFVGGGGEFTVNIALMENFIPVLGVIYLPMKDVLYAAAGQGTAFMQRAGMKEKTPLAVRQPPENGLTVIESRRHGNPAAIQHFVRGYKVAELAARSSSLKFCAIAEGVADLYPRLAPTCEWDTAAGDAILRAAGGHVLALDGTPLRYGKQEKEFLNPFFAACSGALKDSIAAASSQL